MTEGSGKRKAESGKPDATPRRFPLSAFRFRARARRAFSLLEVLLATGILLGSLIVLSELASIGRRRVRDAEDLTAAQRICQTKIQEILAGLQDPIPVEDAEVEDEPGWFYSVETGPVSGQQGLIAVRVTVTQDVAGAGGQAFLPVAGQPRQFALVRWVRDPDVAQGVGDSAPSDASFWLQVFGDRP
jgi:type II secretory pathway pseudopilin PulG